MAKRRRIGCLGWVGIVVLLILLVAYLEHNNFHIKLPGFGSHSNGGLGRQIEPQPARVSFETRLGTSPGDST